MTTLRRPPAAILFVVAAMALPLAIAEAGCPPAPRAPESCAAFGQSGVAIDASGQFDWTASQGPPASADEFVDPAARYQLCAWDEQRLVVAADILPGADCDGASCWSGRGPTTRVYRDDRGANGDVRLLEFHASDRARTGLHVFTVVIGGINLPVTGGVVVQLLRVDTDTCVESFVPLENGAVLPQP